MGTRTKHQDVRAALKTAVETQWTSDAIVAVFSKFPPLSDHYTREDRMSLGEIEFSQEPFTYGTYQERITVDFVIDCPASGNSEDEWEDGSTRSEAILDSVLTALRTDITVGGTVFNVELGSTTAPVDVVDTDGPHGVLDGVFELEVLNL